MHAQAEACPNKAQRKRPGSHRASTHTLRITWQYQPWQYQPCKPPKTQIKRMIGNGMPMSQSNSPRPMTSSSVACFWTVGLTVNGPEGSARRSCAHQLGTRGGSAERLPEGVGFEPHSARTTRVLFAPRFVTDKSEKRDKSWVRYPAARGPGGGGGIRTHDTVSRIHAFQACAFSHSATPPDQGNERNIAAGVRVTTLLVAPSRDRALYS
jgi:hypothetical protein